jgi:hypothetical protein
VSTHTAVLIAPPTRNWIISGREDLTWFIGSSLISYLVLVLMALGFPITPLTLVWLIGIDGPHVAATVTRTYCDPAERLRLGSLLWVVLPAMALGPIMVAAGAEGLFYVFAISWLHYHIAKQHFGFVMLYKHKARERDRLDFLLDRWFLLASLMLPFARFALRGFYPGLFALSLVRWLDILAFVAYTILALVFAARQIQKRRKGEPLNVPKLMLLAVVIPLQWLAFGYAASSGGDGIVRAGIILGLFHSFQYHRLMWFHNRNRYGDSTPAASAGMAALLARNVAWYFGAAVLLNLLLTVLPGRLLPGPYIKAAIWGIPFTHYILDSVIWRVRGNRELATALKLA